MSLESKLLSKIIDEKDISIFQKYNLTQQDFYTEGEAYKFIRDYNSEFGQTPTFEAVVAECKDFEYEAEVSDNTKFLAKQIKNSTARRMAFQMLTKNATVNFDKMKGTDFIEWLSDSVREIKEQVSDGAGLGTNFATNGAERKKYYLARKEEKVYVPTPYDSLNKWLLGGSELGDYVLLMAYTNRGKSWLASDFGLTAWKEGFGVLHYSPELSKGQQVDRLDTLLGHFKNSQMKKGNLDNEELYLNYLDGFNDSNETPYIIKTMGDLPHGLSVDTIEADLQANPNIQMVIIDGFNLMTQKGGSGSSNRDKYSMTSRKLRQIFGRYRVVGLVVHQTPNSAEKENLEEDEVGNRIVKPPEIHQYSETVAVIQDACTVITFDQFEGVGKLKLCKARTPHVGNVLDIHCDFDRGYIAEPSTVDFF